MTPALTNQELLDRYIHSLRMNLLKLILPPDKLEDLAAEIRSNLESLAEDRAAELGRELSLGEMSAMLKQHGHPMVVASRYRETPGRGLIGPDLFPLYWFTLRAIFSVWVAIRIIVAIFTLQGITPAGSVLRLFGRDVLIAAFFIPAGVTLLFALWEYLEFRFRYSDTWKPESLPAVPSPVRPPAQPRPMVQIIGGVVWLIFWALALFVPQFYWVWGGRGVFSPSDTVYAMRPALWLLVFFWTSVSWLGQTRFVTPEWRRFLRAAVVVAGLALGLFLLRSGDLLVAGPRWDPTQAKSLATLNQMVAGVLVLACISTVLMCVKELRRFVRRSSKDGQTADSAS